MTDVVQIPQVKPKGRQSNGSEHTPGTQIPRCIQIVCRLQSGRTITDMASIKPGPGEVWECLGMRKPVLKSRSPLSLTPRERLADTGYTWNGQRSGAFVVRQVRKRLRFKSVDRSTTSFGRDFITSGKVRSRERDRKNTPNTDRHRTR